MNVADILNALRAHEAEVRVDCGRLVVTRDAGPLPDDLLAQMRANKPQLLQALSVKVYCAGCRNLRMAEIMIPGEGGRFVWGCSKGHMEHGHSTPELRRLTAPEVCLQARDYAPIREQERA